MLEEARGECLKIQSAGLRGVHGGITRIAAAAEARRYLCRTNPRARVTLGRYIRRPPARSYTGLFLLAMVDPLSAEGEVQHVDGRA